MTFQIWVALHFLLKIGNHKSHWSDFHVVWTVNYWTCQSQYYGVKYLGQKEGNSILVRVAKLLRLSIVSKFHNETHDPKGQENKIYTIVKGRETFYRRHTVPVTSCNEVKYVLKRVSFGSKDCTEELKLECIFPGPD